MDLKTNFEPETEGVSDLIENFYEYTKCTLAPVTVKLEGIQSE